jgi:uncharacterized delta-60 repeat protein
LRHTATGSPDGGFGTGGRVGFSAPNGTQHGTLLPLTGGGVLAAGTVCQFPASDCYALPLFARVTDAGAPDPSYDGDGQRVDGVDHSDAGDGQRPVAAVRDSQGRILVLVNFDYAPASGSHDSSSMHVFRLLPDGTPDRSYGTDGESASFAQGHYGGRGMAIDAQDRVVVGGRRNEVFGPEPSATRTWRLTPDGAVDPTWRSDGSGEPNALGTRGTPDAIVGQADGSRVLVFGETFGGSSTTLVRLDADGAPDPAFGGDGDGRAPCRAGGRGRDRGARRRALRRRHARRRARRGRVRPDGSLDPAFGGGDGIATVPSRPAGPARGRTSRCSPTAASCSPVAPTSARSCSPAS